MGLKPLGVYIKKATTGTKQGLMFAPEDTVSDVKNEILTHMHFMQPKASQLSKAEKSKITLSFKGEEMLDEKTLGESGVAMNDTLVISWTGAMDTLR